jgi:hypothetical protein
MSVSSGISYNLVLTFGQSPSQISICLLLFLWQEAKSHDSMD